MADINAQLAQLAEPFPADDIEWRIAQAWDKRGRITAKCFAYITNRAIMERLDRVIGPANWHNIFAPPINAPSGQHGAMCGISLRIGDEWVTKWDGADNTDFEALKGGLSDAMKRAAVHWGIGRYLYNLSDNWANVHEDGQTMSKVKIRTGRGRDDVKEEWIKWDPPPLPPWAMPGGSGKPSEPAPPKKTRGKKAKKPANGSEAHKRAAGQIADAKTPVELSDKLVAFVPYFDGNRLWDELRSLMVAVKDRTDEWMDHDEWGDAAVTLRLKADEILGQILVTEQRESAQENPF